MLNEILSAVLLAIPEVETDAERAEIAQGVMEEISIGNISAPAISLCTFIRHCGHTCVALPRPVRHRAARQRGTHDEIETDPNAEEAC